MCSSRLVDIAFISVQRTECRGRRVTLYSVPYSTQTDLSDRLAESDSRPQWRRQDSQGRH